MAVATGVLRQKGFLVSRGRVLDALSSADQSIFDKTGPVTLGNMTIAEVIPLSDQGSHEDILSKKRIVQIAAGLESGSRHPISKAFSEITDKLAINNVEQKVGAGISGMVDVGDVYTFTTTTFNTSARFNAHTDQIKVAIGQPSYIANLFDVVTPDLPTIDATKLPLLLATEQGPLGWVLLEDQLRPGAVEAISKLKATGLGVSLLSGDRESTVADMAQKLSIGRWFGAMSPEQKLLQAKKLQEDGHKLVMVGDGINDVPVLSGADVSVALGDATDFARIHADSIMLSGNLDTLPKAIALARATRSIIRQNLIWALVYNLVALPLAAAGMIPPWAAARGMSTSSLLVVLNALRLNHL
jgi:Cu2+-exporting ATPase